MNNSKKKKVVISTVFFGMLLIGGVSLYLLSDSQRNYDAEKSDASENVITATDADLNGDGEVTLADYQTFQNDYRAYKSRQNVEVTIRDGVIYSQHTPLLGNGLPDWENRGGWSKLENVQDRWLSETNNPCASDKIQAFSRFIRNNLNVEVLICDGKIYRQESPLTEYRTVDWENRKGWEYVNTVQDQWLSETEACDGDVQGFDSTVVGDKNVEVLICGGSIYQQETPVKDDGSVDWDNRSGWGLFDTVEERWLSETEESCDTAQIQGFTKVITGRRHVETLVCEDKIYRQQTPIKDNGKPDWDNRGGWYLFDKVQSRWPEVYDAGTVQALSRMIVGEEARSRSDFDNDGEIDMQDYRLFLNAYLEGK